MIGGIEGLVSKVHISIYKNGILSLVLFLSLWTITAVYFDKNFDACMVESNPYKKDTSFMWMSKLLFYSSVAMLVFFLLQLIVWEPPNPKKPAAARYPKPSLQNAFSISVTLLWYVVTFFVCALGKIALQDHSCALHANSISGHYTFHIYYLLALPHLYFTIAHSEFTLAKKAIQNPLKEERRENQRKASTPAKKFQLRVTKQSVLLCTYIIFVVTAIGTLSRTWIFGFHTLRQILYGSVLAALSHYIAVMLQALALQDRKGPLVLTAVITSGLVVFGLLTVHYSIFPLSDVEVYMSVVTWTVLVYYSWHKYNNKAKQL